MQFIFQPLTWGFFLVLLPLLIHLINLLRQKRVQWAAIDFLIQSDKKHRTWVWLKQLALLLARMAAIAILVAMLAHLATRSQWSSFFGGRTAHHIVLLDDSFSMSDRIGSESAWDRANHVVTQLAQHVATQDSLQRFTLIRFSQASLVTAENADKEVVAGDADAPEAAMVGGGTETGDGAVDDTTGDDAGNNLVDGEQLATAADMMARTVDADFESALEDVRRGIHVSALASSPAAAMTLAQTIIAQSDNESHDVYVVSDFRADHWNTPGTLADSIQQLDSKAAQVNLVRCVETAHSNVALTQLRTLDGIQAAGVPMFVEVTVKNFGADVARQVAIALRVGVPNEDPNRVNSTIELPGVLIDEIGPGESVARRVQVFFAEPGQHVLLAELSADAVAADNRRWCVIDCEDGIPVLVVDGDPDRMNVRYLETVFQPSERVKTGIRVELQSAAFLRDAMTSDLAKFHAIYLLDVPRLDERATRNLETFVSDGGGVAIFLGPQSDLNFYNGWYAGGDGLFPVPVESIRTLPTDGEGAPDLQVEDHPLFRVLLGERNAFIGSIRVQQYVQTESDWTPPIDSTSRVIARLRNNDPLWVEQRFGGGRVVTQLSSLAPRWNSWATQPTFPVLMLELQSYLNTSRFTESDRLVGSPITVSVDPREYQPQVEFQVPVASTASVADAGAAQIKVVRNLEPIGGEARPIAASTLDSHAAAGELGSSRQQGVYSAKLQRVSGEFEQRTFALNVDSMEGDLALASLDRISSAVANTKARLLDAGDMALAARDDDRFSWSQVLLGLLVMLLLAEQLLAYSASYHPSAATNRNTSARLRQQHSGAAR